MAANYSLENLTEGMNFRNAQNEMTRLVAKWEKTGLLKGLVSEDTRKNISQILENQVHEVLKESMSLSTGGASLASSGQVQGVTSIVFPVVRRVFGSLIANELVSVQAMSLPAGLIFYLDYTYGSNVGGDAGLGLSNSSADETYTRGDSLYTNPPGKGVQSGSLAAGGMYDLVGSGYSIVHSGSASLTGSTADIGAWTGASEAWTAGGQVTTVDSFTGSNAKNAQYDPQLETNLDNATLAGFTFVHITVAHLAAIMPTVDPNRVEQLAITAFPAGASAAWGQSYQGGSDVRNLRRLNRRGTWSSNVFTPDAFNGTHVQFVVRTTGAGGAAALFGGTAGTISGAVSDTLSVDTTSGAVLTIPSFESDFGASPLPAIPEIDIKIESIPIVAQTRKLRARWSPELAQDLNAFHSIDAEVELTQVLSQQIALEIDREVLNDLVTQANGARMYWSRTVGKYVNKLTGTPVNLASSLSAGPRFTGNQQDWYQTLFETITDVANTIYKKTLRGQANFIVTSPDVSTVIEHSIAYKPSISIDSEGQVGSPMEVGAEKIGTLSNRYTVYKDPYFVANKILIGFKGTGNLASGYALCPYIPLIMTPTIFDPEHFTPRKMVLSRYGKKCIRSDYYGVVTVLDLNTL